MMWWSVVDFGPVNVNLYHFRLTGKGGGVQGHPVREPAADGNQQVAVVHSHIAGLGAVHSNHAGGEGVPAPQTARAHDGDCHRRVNAVGKLLKLPVRPAAYHAAAAD